jgi:adenine C2-methylase RlmN of 23S rRNA A2503 and tRNA A37
MSAANANRKRSVHFHLWANEEEAALINERMAASGITGFGAFARKMLIDGYHVNIDLSDVREMVRLLKNATNNINQIAKRANETRNIYAEDVEDLRRQYDSLWDAANKILAGLAKIK